MIYFRSLYIFGRQNNLQKAYQVPSVHKAIDILELLRDCKNATFRDICESLHFAPSTCYNVLNTLQERGFIRKDPNTAEYSLSTSLIQLGLQAYNNIDLREIAVPIMKELHAMFDETVYLTILSSPAYEGIVIEKIDSLHAIALIRQIGDKVPLYASATGKSILSGFTDTQLNQYLDSINLVAFSHTTISDKETLIAEINRIRECGYAITRNDLNDGASAVSSPIKDYSNAVVAAVSLAGPVDRMEAKIPEMIPYVKQTAMRISKLIGYKES